MKDSPRKNGKDYSSWFLGVVLLGLIMMVVGLMMASARSQVSRGRHSVAAYSEQSLASHYRAEDRG